jgi:hypothetical protein
MRKLIHHHAVAGLRLWSGCGEDIYVVFTIIHKALQKTSISSFKVRALDG